MRTRPIFRRFIVLLMASCSAVIVYGASIDDGKRLYYKGNTTGAHKKFKSVYKNNPDNSLVMFYYAATAPCSIAIPMLTALTQSKISDSIKASAWDKIGDYHFAMGDFTTARVCFQSSYKLNSNPESRHKWALSASHNGEVVAAQSLWHTMTMENDSLWAEKAHYHIAVLYLKQQEYDKAYGSLLKSGLEKEMNYYVAALAGKIFSAHELGMSDKENIYRTQFQKVKGTPLERDLIQSLPLSIKHEATSKKTESFETSKNSDEQRLTLQVGAFGSEENAIKLMDKLASKFSDIRIVRTIIAETVFFRVHIGSFNNKETAEKYATKNMQNESITWRVVTKEN